MTDGPLWWEKEDTKCPDCGHLFHQHYPDCHKPCREEIAALKDAVNSLWGELPVDNVKFLLEQRPELAALCRRVHEELWHGH